MFKCALLIKGLVEQIAERSKKKSQLGLDVSDKDRILIVSPHPDDESIGCGGIIAKYSSQCDVLLMTDGGTGNPEWTYEKTVRVRTKEFQSAMEEGKVHDYIQLNCLSDSYNKFKKTKVDMDLSVYQHIFVPNSRESHIEHRITYMVMMKALKRQHIHTNVYEYEVWTPMNDITNYLDISDYIIEKNKLIQNYKSQLKHIDYISAINGLNCYRGMQYHIKYAEAYKLHINIYTRMVNISCKVLNMGIGLLYRIYLWIVKGMNNDEN